MAKIKDLITRHCFNREEYIERFEVFLAGNGKPIMMIQGIAGVGKTTLLKYLHKMCMDNGHICTYVDWVKISRDNIFVLKELQDQLTEQGVHKTKKFFKSFDKTFSQYLNLHLKLHAQTSDKQKEIAIGAMNALTFTLKELFKPVPFSTPVLDLANNTYANIVNVLEKLPQNDKNLLLDPVQHLTKEFCRAVSQLSKGIQSDKKALFFFDSLEKLEQDDIEKEVDWEVWLRDSLIGETEGVLFVLATRSSKTLQRWSVSGGLWQKVVDYVPLLEYSPDVARLYLAENNVRDNHLVESILAITHRHPFALDLILDWMKRDPLLQGIDIRNGFLPSKDIQQNVLSFANSFLDCLLEDCDLAVGEAAVLRCFNGDSLKFVLGKDCLDNIKTQFFVEYDHRTGNYRYYDLIRNALNERLRGEYYDRYIELHQKSVDYYSELLEKVSDIRQWEFALIESIYHRMVIEEEDGLNFASDMFERAREALQFSLCSVIISEVSQLTQTSKGRQIIRFLEGKLLRTQNQFDAAGRLFAGILQEPEFLSDKLRFEVEVALGEILYLKGDNSKSLIVLQSVISLMGSSQDEYPATSGNAHWYLGRIYRSQGKMDLAIEHLEQSSKFLAKTGRDYLVGHVLCTLGEVYQMRGDYTEAVKPLTESINLLREKGSRTIYGRSMHILGRVYQFQGKWEEAQSLLEASLRIRQEVAKGRPQYSLGFAHWGLGWFYLLQRNFKEALKHLNKSLEIFKTIDSKDGIARTYRLIAEIYLFQEEFERAYELFRNAIIIQESRRGNYELGSLYLGLTEWNIALENWIEAREMNKKAKEILEINGDKKGQMEAKIHQLALETNTGYAEKFESLLSQIQEKITSLNYSDLIYKVELLRAEYAVDADDIDSGIKAYKQAYQMAKEFHESHTYYVTKKIIKKIQSISKAKANYILTALPEIPKDFTAI